jgi:hypothetical protein
MTSKIILTPINLVSRILTANGKKAREDYIREQGFIVNGNNAKWDDSKYNSAVVNDYFAFVHQKENRVEIFQVVKIINAEDRPEYWNLPEHMNRNVLHLSKMIANMTWTDLKSLLDYKDTFFLRGTSRSKKQITL